MDQRCPICWSDDGGSHYHCPQCGGVCSMMGHTPEQCEAYRRKQMAKKTAPKQGPQDVDDPDVVGPTVESVDDEDAPILIGKDGDTDFEVVTLEGGGPGGGRYRVTAPAPQVVVSHGARYVLSDRETLVYHWEG